MRVYLIRRLLLIIPTLFIVTVVVFATVRFIPGDVIDLMVSEIAEDVGVTADVTIEYIKEALGLDVPVHVQYGRWIGGAFQGDLGRSLWTQRPVTEDILSRLPISLQLGSMAILIGLTIAIPVGVYSAIRQDTGVDYLGRTMAIMGLSLPNFWLATMLMIFPAIWWGWSPAVEYIPLAEDPAGNLGQFIWPAIIMGTAQAAATMRMTRTMMLEVLRQDYIRTAWAKGLTERTVVIRHALKNALIPVITMVGLQIPVIIGGSAIMETIFSLPGVGLLLIDAINKRDYPVISGINLILASFVLTINLVVDVTYSFLDPRVRFK